MRSYKKITTTLQLSSIDADFAMEWISNRKWIRSLRWKTQSGVEVKWLQNVFLWEGGVCCYSIPLAYSTRSGKEHAVVQQIYIPLWLMMATDWSSTEHIFFQLHTRGSSPYLKRSLLRWDSWVASIALVDSNATSSKPFVVFISKSFTCFSPSLLPTPPPFFWYFINLEWQPLCSHRYKSLLAICSIEKRGGIYLLWKLDGKHQ